MRDMLPARAAHRRSLARTILDAFARRGYDAVVPPVFEREEVVSRALDARTRSDLVRFFDPDAGDVLALRPDMTPQIARIVATRLREAPRPLRLAYEGSVVRRPRRRAHRHRQVAQAGIECVGAPDVEADAEVLITTCEALTAAGITAWCVELSHAGIVRAVLERVAVDVRDDVADALARRDRATWRPLLGPAGDDTARTLDALTALAGAHAALDEAPRALAGVVDEAIVASLLELRALLVGEGYGDRLLVDLGEARRQGYYTGSVFQVLCEGTAEPLASGGRYDTLIARYGLDVPATGCALDMEALEDLSASSSREARGPERVLVVGPAPWRRTVATAQRAAGCHVAEHAPCPAEEALAYAQAHGHERVLLAAFDGSTVTLTPPRSSC
jgi:ATP phosphoribosyltransferase regulatory subunit